MAIERYGHFVEFKGDEGIRNIVRVSAIQWMCDTDETAEESLLCVAGRTLLVRAPLDDLRNALMDDGRLRMMPFRAGEV